MPEIDEKITNEMGLVKKRITLAEKQIAFMDDEKLGFTLLVRFPDDIGGYEKLKAQILDDNKQVPQLEEDIISLKQSLKSSSDIANELRSENFFTQQKLNKIMELIPVPVEKRDSISVELQDELMKILSGKS